MKQRDRIHSVIVSYNRWELTKQAITTYLDTVTLPYTLIVVDNKSELEIQEALNQMAWESDFSLIILDDNRYPGFATNYGWHLAADDVTFLHRADNDFAFLPGWCDEVLRCFEDSEVGQVGLRTAEEELWNGHNVGGNNVIRRELWDQGLRYDERTWPQISKKVPGYTEDSFLSPAVKKLGWSWTRVERPCIRSLAVEDPDDPYYQETWRVRGITPPAKETNG